MAKSGRDRQEILMAVSQVVQNCVIGDENINNWPIVDVEWAFIQIRGYSISDAIKMSFVDPDDNKQYDFEVKTSDVGISGKPPKPADNVIKINATAGLTMRAPTASLYQDKEVFSDDNKMSNRLLARSIDTMFDGDAVYKASEYKQEELDTFIDELDLKSYQSMIDISSSWPTLLYTIKYENSTGKKREIRLTTLDDFFTLA